MTDSIWTGNSGAPLLNLEGKVIGMFVSNYDTGDNQISDLAIPSNALKAMLTRPSRGKESVQIGNEKTDSLDSRPTVPQLAKKALAATVSLQMQDENGVIQGRGSGFFVRRNLIATNFHVIDGATKGNMRLVNTKTTYRIDGVTATDESNDLALLKVAVKGVKPLLLGDSDAVEVGETVYAAGNPLGFEGTFSDGIVSGRRDSATKHARLQMTAPISPGSSGGPVLNRDGEVIGVSTSVYNPLFGQNLNFAVPSKALKALLTQSGEAKPLSTRNTSFSHIGYLRRGNEKSLSGDFEGAIREFTQAIRLNPKFVSAYVNRGIAKSDLGKLNAAVADYDVAISLDPDYALAYVARGVAKRKLGKHHAAIADFDTAIRINPDADTYIHRGVVKAELKQYTNAIADYDTAIRINRHDALAYTFRGFAKGKLGQHVAAISDYDAALRLDPNNESTYYSRGNAKKKLGRFSSAITDYDIAIRLDPKYAKAYLNRGVAKAELSQHIAAIADFDAAIRLNPDYAFAYYCRGLTEARLGQHSAAITNYDVAIRLNPNYADAYYNRGLTKARLGEHLAAIADYNVVLRLDPNDANAYFLRGRARYRLDRYSAAIADFDVVTSLSPDYAEAYLDRALCNAMLSRYSLARQDFSTAEKLANRASDQDLKSRIELWRPWFSELDQSDH